MLNKQSSTPLYNQLLDLLIKTIETSAKPDDKMPSEREICERYGVSRTTVRAALRELEELGYIYRRHGKGTYVSALWKEMKNLSDTYSFTEHMKQLGMRPETRILSFEMTRANRSTGERLRVPEGSDIYKLRRLRLANGMPMMLEVTFIPLHLFPGLNLSLLESMPLYDLYRTRYGHELKYADEEFYASLVQDKEAEFLGVPVDSACLRLIRTTYNAKNEVVEFTISAARADQFVYKIRHSFK